MKKSLVLGFLGLAAGAVSSYGQGAIFLDNYLLSTDNPVYEHTFLGTFLLPAGYTVGLYYDPTANQNIAAAVNAAEAADPFEESDPHSLNAALVAATGPGSTAPIYSMPALAGYFSASSSFLIQPGATVPAQSSYTIMLVAYNGATYDTSIFRGYSAAVYIQDAAPSIAQGGDIGEAFPANTPLFTIFVTPEPGTLALAGLGGLALWLMRRKKA